MWGLGQEFPLDRTRFRFDTGPPFALATSRKAPPSTMPERRKGDVTQVAVHDVESCHVTRQFGGSCYSAEYPREAEGVIRSRNGGSHYGREVPVQGLISNLEKGTFTGAAGAGWTYSRRGTR
jgi:hypothetical protein